MLFFHVSWIDSDFAEFDFYWSVSGVLLGPIALATFLAKAYLNDNFICIDSGFPVEVLFSPSGTTVVEGTLLRTCKVAILIESYFEEGAPQLISCSGCNVKEDPRRNRFKLRIFGKSKFNVFIVFLISSGNVPRSPIDFFGYICKDFFKRKLKFCYTS